MMEETSPRADRSVRALVLALAMTMGGLVLANYHDGTITHRELSQHHYVAPIALATLFTFIAGINTLLRRFRRAWAFTPAELAIAMTLTLVATPMSRFFASPWVGTVGFTQSLLDVRHPGLAPLVRTDIMQTLPEGALLDAADSRRFDEGLVDRVGTMAAPADIPWRVWIRPALIWAPLLLTFLSLSVSMGYMLYRQWAERELLPFPLAEFAAELLRHDQDRAAPDLFYNRSFWWGFGIMVVVFTVNGLHAHVPNMIRIPTNFQFYELAEQFAFLKHSHEGYSLLRGWMFFAVVAVAVLLPAEISFTAWVTWPVMVVGTYLYYIQTGERFSGNVGMVQMGSTWAMAGVILYAGRTYYLGLLRSAIGLGAGTQTGGIDRQSVNICRVFLLSVVAFVFALTRYGVPPDLAILWTLALLVVFLVTCRLVAEMGIPWMPVHVLLPLPFLMAAFGEATLGIRGMALLAIISTVLLPTRITLFLIPPMIANAIHVEARVTGRLRTPALVAPFLLVVLVLAAATAIWMGYSHGGAANDYPLDGFGEINGRAESIGNRLQDSGIADGLNAHRPMGERWRALRMQPRLPAMFGFGAALVLVTGVARLRFPRFPLHPLPMVLLGSWIMSRFWFSFLLGWLIKQALLKIGGGRLFTRARPFFIGVVVGLTLIYTTWLLANVAIFWNNRYTFQDAWLVFFRFMISN